MLNILSSVRYCSVLLVALLVMTKTQYVIGQDDELDAAFCWKDTYGRGVGVVPDMCRDGRVKIGALCYSRCPNGWRRFGFDCHQTCPSGFRDDGLFCRKVEVGRGVGYPWWFGDWFDLNGAKSRCERDHGSGNCEQCGLIMYPKCPAGMWPVTCNICRPHVPNCPALGMVPGFDLSCGKQIRIGDPVGMSCRWNQQYDAGLCYPNCKPNFTGIGPVCWGQPPGQPPQKWVGKSVLATFHTSDSGFCWLLLIQCSLSPLPPYTSLRLRIWSRFFKF